MPFRHPPIKNHIYVPQTYEIHHVELIIKDRKYLSQSFSSTWQCKSKFFSVFNYFPLSFFYKFDSVT